MQLHTTPSRQRSAWLSAARSDYMLMGDLELTADIESLCHEVAESQSFDPVARAVVDLHSGERLRLARAELQQRQARFAAGADVSDPDSASYDQWRDLARQIRAQGDIVSLMQTAGFELRRHGREYSTWCPACGGEDRYVVWAAADGEHPRTWCRQCGLREDVIDIYRNHLVPGATFIQALRVLALQLNLQVPDHGSKRAPMKRVRSSRRVIPLRQGGRRVAR